MASHPERTEQLQALLARLDPLLITLLALSITTAAIVALHGMHQTAEDISSLSDVPAHLLTILEPPPPPPPLPPAPVIEEPDPKTNKNGKATNCGSRRVETRRQKRELLVRERQERDQQMLEDAGVLGALR